MCTFLVPKGANIGDTLRTYDDVFGRFNKANPDIRAATRAQMDTSFDEMMKYYVNYNFNPNAKDEFAKNDIVLVDVRLDSKIMMSCSYHHVSHISLCIFSISRL